MYGYEDLTPRQRYDIILDNLDAMYDALKQEVASAQEVSDNLQEDIWAAQNKISAAEERTNVAYSQRAIAAVSFAHTVIALGGAAGVGRDSREDQPDEWRVVLYVDTPAGQLSWHIAPEDQPMLEGLPEYQGTWDGTYNSSDTSFYKGFLK